MGYSYTTFTEALSLEAQIPISGASANAAFISMLPTIIDQSEQLIYRDLQLVATIVADSSGATTPNQRTFTLPTASGRFVVLQSVNILNGTERTPLTKASREVLDFFWPNSVGVLGVTPTKWAPLTDQVIILGPSPASALTLECVGTIRPAALSVANPNTFISDYLPDLLLTAAMFFTAGYKQNFGAQADNPKLAISWKDTYDRQLQSAQIEEMQRKYQSFYTTAVK